MTLKTTGGFADHKSISEYYDRNPVSSGIGYDAGGIPPHGSTVRSLYTVPANKKAFVAACIVNITRDAVAITPSFVLCRIQDNSSRHTAFARIYSNNIGDKDNMATGQSLTLLSGASINITTWDNSIGGSVAYVASAFITEFDA